MLTKTQKNIQAVLFDLDGTLLDTAPDLGIALNQMLSKRNLPLLSSKIMRPEAGRGCKGLLKLALNITEQHPEFPALCDEFMSYYEKHLLDTTQLFTGMEYVLEHLEQSHIAWGIVTNKPARFTSELVKKLNLAQRTPCIISGDTFSNRKPHPEPILQACQLLNQPPYHCLYIGDSEVDIIASKAAGTHSLAALYGYVPDRENPRAWEADGYIEHPLDIISWLKN